MSRYSYWRPYVPVDERYREGERFIRAWEKKHGVTAQPVEITGRKIAKSFWGKAWCDHMESFGDYANRLPRGRTYVCNGSVCHLGIARGGVEAFVAGSDVYQVKISISQATESLWESIKQRCSGKIGTLLELLQGKFSKEVMEVVTDPKTGLFPQSREIKYTCSCPDSARMCKHIAAVMYGIGARLDESPELLFTLRGVDQQELIQSGAKVDEIVEGGGSSRRTIAAEALEDVFGVEFDDEEPPTPIRRKATAARKKVEAKENSDTTETFTGQAEKIAKNPPRPRRRKPRKSSVTKKVEKVPMQKALVKKEVRAKAPAKNEMQAKPPVKKTAPAKKSSPKKTTPAKSPSSRKIASSGNLPATASSIRNLRTRLNQSVTAFAVTLGVSAQSIRNWEAEEGVVNLSQENLAKFRRVQRGEKA